MMARQSKVTILLMATLAICCLSEFAWACPTCKESLVENGQAGRNLARGFELSIYLMLAAPAAILSVLATVFYFQIYAARKNGSQPSMGEVIALAEAGMTQARSAPRN